MRARSSMPSIPSALAKGVALEPSAEVSALPDAAGGAAGMASSRARVAAALGSSSARRMASASTNGGRVAFQLARPPAPSGAARRAYPASSPPSKPTSARSSLEIPSFVSSRSGSLNRMRRRAAERIGVVLR